MANTDRLTFVYSQFPLSISWATCIWKFIERHFIASKLYADAVDIQIKFTEFLLTYLILKPVFHLRIFSY